MLGWLTASVNTSNTNLWHKNQRLGLKAMLGKIIQKLQNLYQVSQITP